MGLSLSKTNLQKRDMKLSTISEITGDKEKFPFSTSVNKYFISKINNLTLAKQFAKGEFVQNMKLWEKELRAQGNILGFIKKGYKISYTGTLKRCFFEKKVCSKPYRICFGINC